MSLLPIFSLQTGSLIALLHLYMLFQILYQTRARVLGGVGRAGVEFGGVDEGVKIIR
jgi:hypothetical protein